MAKSTAIKPITIENWPQGIAPSPLLGFGMMKNVDITTYPGAVRLNNLMAKVSGSTVTGSIIGFRRNPKQTTDIWAYDNNAKVYKSTDNGGIWSVVTGNSAGIGSGIGLWNDYLFVATNTALDAYGPLSSSPTWYTIWQTLDADPFGFHTMLESVDNNLYICAGRYVSKVEAIGTFSPGSPGTYTWTAHAITLGYNYRTKCLADLGQFLMVGTWQGSNIYDLKVADIFPYTRSDLTLGVPLKLNKNGVNAMLSVNNRLYIQAGLQGEIFESDAASFVEISHIPNYVANIDGGFYMYGMPGSIMNHQGKIFFGLSGGSIGNMGVYSIVPGREKNVLVMENELSPGDAPLFSAIEIGALISTNRDIYLAGWMYNNVSVLSYGIDKINNGLRCTSGYVEGPLQNIGMALANRTISSLEVTLQKPLVSGQGVRIKYRKNLTDSFTTLDTIDITTYPSIATNVSVNISAATITNAVFLQVRAELTTGVSNLTPEVTSIKLIPSE